jgi:hypothetical protein
MSTQFDTALGFIIVMSIVSLLIMVATQMWSAFFGLRGLNLADALETMLHKLAPEIHEDGCRQLITDVLTHPAISDSTVSLRRPGLLSRMMPAFLRLRWSRATAVRPDELGQMLRTVSTGPLAAIHRILPQMERNLREAIAAEGGALPERIAALRTVETAITHLGATVNNVFNKTLSSKEVSQQVGSLLEEVRTVFEAYANLGALAGAGAPAANDVLRARDRFGLAWNKMDTWKKQRAAFLSALAANQLTDVLAEAEQDGEKFEKWFNSAQNRAQQWFSLHARAVTVAGAIIAALILQLDTVQLVKSISHDPALRAKLIARADALAQREESIIANPTSKESLTKAMDSLRQEHPEWKIDTGYSGTEVPAQWLSQHAKGAPNSQEVTNAFQQELQKAILGSDATAFSAIQDEAAGDSLILMPNPYPASPTHSWPIPFRLWKQLDNGTTIYWSWPLYHLIGILLSAALLSLGGPFWFSLLKQMAALRPALAGAVDGAPKQKSTP